MGIMGKTQGVKMEARPKPKATARNARSPSAGAAGVDDGAGAGACGSGDPAGGTTGVGAPVHVEGPAGLALPGRLGGEKGKSGGARGGVLLQFQFEQEGHVALVG